MTVDAEQNQDEVNKEIQSKIEEGYNIYYTVYKKWESPLYFGNMHMI